MTPRSLFNIILKILGIFFIKDILITLPQLLSVSYMLKDDQQGAIFTFIVIILTLLAYIFVSYFLIFKSGYLIDKLKLEKGFNQESFTLNIDHSTILSISIIVIGGLIIVQEIPNLCRQLLAYFQEKRMTLSISYSVLAAAKILVGFLLIGNQKQLVNFIERKKTSGG